jgi:hypothetical protein
MARLAAGRPLAHALRRCLGLALLLASAIAAPAHAWSGHTTCTREALSVMPELAQARVKAESLERFVMAEAPRLEALLREHEAWARANLPHYPARPDVLAFTADATPAVPRFLQALRLNGESRLKLFVQLQPGQVPEGKARMPWVDITALKSGSAARENTYVLLDEGEAVPVIDLVASASNEPDYGLDIGLFVDNGTAQGRRFGFGTQPFGSPSVDYSSQAPFHMGFFHEGRIVNSAAAFLQRTHPESRIALFSALSRHAFATGHDYWGWRFAGWAMHYVQDLTQPYHARVLPGLSTLRMLWINGLDMAGFPSAKNDAIHLVTNRHIVLENFQLRRVNGATETQQRDDPLLAALRDTTRDAELHVYTPAATRAVVSAESAASADALDAQLARSFPARYVDDPAQPLGNEADRLDMAQIAREAPPAEQAALERQLAELLGRYGRYTRAVVRALMPPR